jgi:hypothetical protein
MKALDVAGLVVVAGRVLGIGTDAALAQIDIPAAQAALAAATPGEALQEDRAASAAAAWARLVHALLRHPPFPGHRQHLAAAAGLQLLAVNGWQADLDPPGVAAVVIEALDRGRLTPAAAATWLAPRLSTRSAPRTGHGPGAAVRRGLRLLSPLPGPGAAGMSVGGRMLARFTDPAIAVIVSAQQEARRVGHGSLDPEHLLLGLLSQEESVAVQALTMLGVSLEGLRRQLRDGLVPGHQTPAGPIRPSRPRGQKALSSALPEALALAGGKPNWHGCVPVGTEHLLLAQFHDDGPATQALAQLGAGEIQVRGAITAVLAAAGPAPRDFMAHQQRPKRSARASQIELLQREVTRLRELLKRHGIDPCEDGRESA